MAESEATRTLEAKCFCGTVHLTLDVGISRLPLAVYLCHCSICRYATGSPCVFHTQLPEGLVPKFVGRSSEDKLNSYAAPGGAFTYEFCSTCGCHVGAVRPGRRQWIVATSIFRHHRRDTFQIRTHVFSKSAKGGGLASMLGRVGDSAMATWDPPDDHPRAGAAACEAETGADGLERLRLRCHCGGVSFTVRRPTQQVLDDASLSKAASPVDGSLATGTAKTYSSSGGVLRSFCGTCGATVLAAVLAAAAARQPNEGPAVVHAATGIVRAPDGVMAEDWLTWRTRVAFAPSGMDFDRDFGEALAQGMRAWTRERYGDEVDFAWADG